MPATSEATSIVPIEQTQLKVTQKHYMTRMTVQ